VPEALARGKRRGIHSHDSLIDHSPPKTGLSGQGGRLSRPPADNRKNLQILSGFRLSLVQLSPQTFRPAPADRYVLRFHIVHGASKEKSFFAVTAATVEAGATKAPRCSQDVDCFEQTGLAGAVCSQHELSPRQGVPLGVF